MMAVRKFEKAQAVERLQWFAVRMVPPTNGHRRTTKIGGEKRVVRHRSGCTVKRRKPGTGEKVFVSEHILKKHGFAVFLPVKKNWRRKHRFTSERELVAFPYLKDWMFVGWPTNENRWSDLLSLKVVAGVLGSDGMPLAIKPAVIDKLMMVWGDGVPPAVKRVAARAFDGIALDSKVRVITGPFEDFTGQVVDIDGEGAQVALQLFGRESVLAFQFGDIKPLMPVMSKPKGLLDNGAPACLRCGEAMALAHRAEKKPHLRCGHCGGCGAVNSDSEISALNAWCERVC